MSGKSLCSLAVVVPLMGAGGFITTSPVDAGLRAVVAQRDADRALARAEHPSWQLVARLAQAGATVEDFRANLRAVGSARDQSAPEA